MSEVTINGLIEGGKATGGPPFGPALGPLGVNINDYALNFRNGFCVNYYLYFIL